tara:strand:+ start:145 stop:282 length:138 start_codon:yes stop_codon:yes gene_type:complete
MKHLITVGFGFLISEVCSGILKNNINNKDSFVIFDKNVSFQKDQY